MNAQHTASRFGTALPSLVRWGLSPDADLVYRTLVSLVTAREGQIAHELGMPHPRVRAAMRELADAGAIHPVASAARRMPKASGRAVWAARQPSQVVGQLRGQRLRLVGPVEADPNLAGRRRTPDRALYRDLSPEPQPGQDPTPGPDRAPYRDVDGGTHKSWPPIQVAPTETVRPRDEAPIDPVDPMTALATAEQTRPEQTTVILTPRERAIVDLLAQGHTDETAARALELSRRTVGYALGALMNRLGVDNRFQLGLALGAIRAAVPAPRCKD